MTQQLPLLQNLSQPQTNSRRNSEANKLAPEDTAIHDWYRFVLSFPPHLVRDYLNDFQVKDDGLILDPFCGTGTTLVESKLQGYRAVGVESNPVAHFASTVKLDWSVEPDSLDKLTREVARLTLEELRSQGVDDSGLGDASLSKIALKNVSPEAEKLLIKNSISPLPLHKTLVLLDVLNKFDSYPCYNHARLALATAAVSSISNLRFGPEVGVGKKKKDVPVVASWLQEVTKMVRGLHLVNRGGTYPRSIVHLSDARDISSVLEPSSIDAVITSPPYPNEKDYSRTTRLEAVLLGFINNKEELRAFKKTLLRSNTRGVYKKDDDDRWVVDKTEIQEIADAIEQRRIELGKTSGFERLYARVTRLYFGGMTRHLSELRPFLRPGAQLAYVVGDQASYLQIMIRTGTLLADIAEALGYEVLRIDLFRTRLATATKKELREEVVVLRWPG